MVSGQWSVGSGQWSVVGGRWSVVGGQWSVVGGQWSVVGGRWSVVSGQWSVVGGQWSVGSGQWSGGGDLKGARRVCGPGVLRLAGGSAGCRGADPRGNSFLFRSGRCWHRTFVLRFFSMELPYRRAGRGCIRRRCVSWCPGLSQGWTGRSCLQPCRVLRGKDPCRKRPCLWRVLVRRSRRRQNVFPTCPPVWPLCPTMGQRRLPVSAPGPLGGVRKPWVCLGWPPGSRRWQYVPIPARGAGQFLPVRGV